MLGKKGCTDSSRLHELATPKDPHPTILSLLIQCMTTTPFCTCSCAYFRQQHQMKLTHYKLGIQLYSANCVDDGISGSRRYNGGRTLKRYEIGAPWKQPPGNRKKTPSTTTITAMDTLKLFWRAHSLLTLLPRYTTHSL
jgi:hypothetical protein